MLPFIAFKLMSLFFDNAMASENSTAPTITLDQGVFTGSAAGSVEMFLNIPYAKPPIGDLRFRPAEAIPEYNGDFDVTAHGNACPQQTISTAYLNFTALPNSVVQYFSAFAIPSTEPQSEDCLTLDVVRPKMIPSHTKLPVVVWIYGGAFQVGSTSSFDGGPIVERSVALGKPVIYVAMNYRVSGFGFLTGHEVKTAGVGNIGLRDQREALRWVQKYIPTFGGDHTKVTIWGESAGAWSVGLHMVANRGNTENLFHSAFMQSGSINQLDNLDAPNEQQAYDTVVSQTGCAGSSNTLDCLRSVPYDQLKAVFDSGDGLFSYKGLMASWLPRPDGLFITDFAQSLLAAGKVAQIPFVCGDVDDEGPLFSMSSINVTTDAEFRAYVKNVHFPNISDKELDALALAYPDDVTQGSPFDTGTNNSITPQFKRIAAFQGDFFFDAPRRNLLDTTLGKQNAWSYVYKRAKSTPYFGAAHGSDIASIFSGTDMTDFLINFAVSSDPNGVVLGIHWPKYSSHPTAMAFLDGEIPLQIIPDTFRKDAMALLTKISQKYPG